MTTTTDLAAVREAALDLALATWYDEALRLLDATQTDDPQGRLLLALTAADVADRADHVFGRSEAPKRFEALDAELAAYEPDPSLAWNVAWVRVRRGYSLAIRNPDGSYRMGPDGREPGEVDALVAEATRLRDEAPDEARRGWASMCLGWITDNLLADRDAAPAHYEPALEAARASGDPVLLFEAQRHLGDHAHDDGDLAGARERWEESTAAGARARHIGGTLSQQLLLAVLHRDEGDEAGARAIAGEVLRWARAIGAVERRTPGRGLPGRRRPDPRPGRPGMTRSAQAWVAATDVTRAYLAEQYDEALRITDELLERFPDRFASLSQLRAEVLVQLGRPDDALATAAAVLDAGRWWSDRQVGSLEEEGLDLGEVGTALRSRAQQEVDAARTRSAVVEVRSAGRGWVTVVVLHMYGVPAAETLEVWEPVVAAGVDVVTVESTLVDGDGYPCWDQRDLALRDLDAGIAAAPGGVPLVLAGASQGAGLAASAALNGEARADAWLAVVGAPRPGVARMERLSPVRSSSARTTHWLPQTSWSSATRSSPPEPMLVARGARPLARLPRRLDRARSCSA